MRNCVLILEPDAGVSRFMQLKLEEEGFNCLTDNTGDSAVDLAGQRQVDIILLDPDSAPRNGMELLGKVREISSIPIIYLSSDSSVDTKVAVLNAGADDYITKPFELQEVLARVQVQLRRGVQGGNNNVLSHKQMVLDREKFQIEVGGKLLGKITKQEFSILELLLKHPKQVFSKEDIFEYACEEPYMGETKTLDVHISNIRKKIKEVTKEEYIETVWGIGYRLQQ